MTPDRFTMHDYSLSPGLDISLGDDRIISGIGTGASAFSTGDHKYPLGATIHAPDLGNGLLSIGQATGSSESYKFHFDGDRLDIFANDSTYVSPHGSIIPPSQSRRTICTGLDPQISSPQTQQQYRARHGMTVWGMSMTEILRACRIVRRIWSLELTRLAMTKISANLA